MEEIEGGKNNPDFLYRLNDFTVVYDYKTKYYCWALQNKDGWLESTGYPVHLHNPEQLGLEKNIRMTNERAEEVKASYRNVSEDKHLNN